MKNAAGSTPVQRFTKRQAENVIRAAQKRALREVAGHASRGGKYAHGLSSEGYAGGYADALADVLLALRGVKPSTRDYWEDWKP